jgi:hypothetical protein
VLADQQVTSLTSVLATMMMLLLLLGVDDHGLVGTKGSHCALYSCPEQLLVLLPPPCC